MNGIKYPHINAADSHTRPGSYGIQG